MSDTEENNLSEIDDVSGINNKACVQYKKCYDRFMEWRKKENISTVSEKALLSYFKDIATKYAPTTLMVEYTALKMTLKLYEKTDITTFAQPQQFLKQMSEGYVTKKTKTFSPLEIERFIREAPDVVYLCVKVAAIFGVLGSCTRQEMHRLLFKDVKILNDTLIVNIMKKKDIDRTFAVSGKYYDIVKKFIDLRPRNSFTGHFFVKYFNGKCHSFNVGINSLGLMGKKIATYLNLPEPELYTGLCFKRTAASLISDGLGSNIVKALKTSARKERTNVLSNIIEHSVQEEVAETHSSDGFDYDVSAPLPEPPECGPGAEQCRFCGFVKECFPVDQTVYLMGNKTTLALNHLRVELDFSIDTLPKTVCRDCDSKLVEILEFIKQVNTAQFSLLTVCANNATSAANLDQNHRVIKRIVCDSRIVKIAKLSTHDHNYDVPRVQTEVEDGKVDIYEDITIGERVYSKGTDKMKYEVDYTLKVKKDKSKIEKPSLAHNHNYDFGHIEIDTEDIKHEYDSTDEDAQESKVEIHEDLLTIGETVFLRETHKRKNDDNDDKRHKKVKKESAIQETETKIDIKEEIIDNDDGTHELDDKMQIKVKKERVEQKDKGVKMQNTEIIIDIKEEIIDNDDVNSEYNDMETDVKPSELELRESDLNYQKRK
ncbi:uncharacterized protein LOC125238590 [Leguminivora glycinivorella]|uniref:uncharacterized protein LOC125238590 n=1 Tax=Leguminivora glycinivorella TaxID=1035111 RepID=UPI00200E170C|nr:uncharacterized protein LOC125238590 [Leguminivora glycinivorella]